MQEAYNQQEQKRREMQQKIDIANEEIAHRCCVCFESSQHMKNIPCEEYHREVLICNDCCLLLYTKNKPCPLCRKELLKNV